jgi:DNA repair exonuclease SbcCD ATPase subunit
MCRKRISRFLALFLAAASLFALRLPAQDKPSIADAARRARQQKQAALKPAPVITNDTLRPAAAPTGAASASTEASADSTAASPSTASTKQIPRADAEEDAERKKPEIAELKQQIAEKQEALKLLQRDLLLKQDTFYSNPDHQHDSDGKSKLDSVETDIQHMQDDLAALQAKLADLGPEEKTRPAPSQP